MASGNPVFAPAVTGDIFSDWASAERRGRVMTVQGTAIKALILLVILTTTAVISWGQAGNPAISGGLLIGGLIGGLIAAMVTIFKRDWAPVTAPIYAACEGLVLGAISNLFERQYPGIAVQAVGVTFATMFAMLFIYMTGMIRVTDRLVRGVVAATGGICLFYFVAWILSFFGVVALNKIIFGAGPIGIAFSVFVVGLAAFNLLLDFDFIEKGARAEAPKSLEWYGAFGLMVTLVWLYLEVLRLLSKLRSRND